MTQHPTKTNGTAFAGLVALTVTGAASAAIDPTKYVGWDYWGSSAQSALTAAGYTDMTGSGAGTGGALLSVQTDCGPFGCFTMPQATGLTGNALKGYVRFQFQDFNYTNYTGLWVWLQFQYTPTGGLTPQTLSSGQQTNIINAVNAQTFGLGGTMVTAYTAQNASQQTDAFANFLPSSMSNPNNIFFNWYPVPQAPTTSGLSQVFVFAWDFTNVAAIAGNSTWGVSGAGTLPAPGAVALLGIGGLLGGSRRRRA